MPTFSEALSHAANLGGLAAHYCADGQVAVWRFMS